MLIEFLFEKFPNFEDANETAIGDLQVSANYQIPLNFEAEGEICKALLAWTEQIIVDSLSFSFLCVFCFRGNAFLQDKVSMKFAMNVNFY